MTSSSPDSTTSTTSEPMTTTKSRHHPSHHQKAFPNIDQQRLSKTLISTNLRMLLSQINDIILLKAMYSSLTPGVNLLDSQSSLSFHPQTIDTFSSIGFLGHFDIDHPQSNQDDVVRKIPNFLKRSIAHPSSNPIEFQITPLWYRSLAGKYPDYICLFHAQPCLFVLILYCSIEMKKKSQKFHYEHNSSSMFVFRAKSIEERKRIISCLFTRAKHCAHEECQREHGRTNIRWTNQVCFENEWWGTENERSWMNLDTCSTNSSCATSIYSNVDSCTTGTTSQSSVESSSPNPLRSSIAEEEDDADDDEDGDEYQWSIPPPPEFGPDEESCPILCSSSSSLSDGDLENVSSNAIPTNSPSNSTTTGQLLWIDHYSRRHSIANDTDLLEPNHFHYHPSSPFALDRRCSRTFRFGLYSHHELGASPLLSIPLVRISSFIVSVVNGAERSSRNCPITSRSKVERRTSGKRICTTRTMARVGSTSTVERDKNVNKRSRTNRRIRKSSRKLNRKSFNWWNTIAWHSTMRFKRCSSTRSSTDHVERTFIPHKDQRAVGCIFLLLTGYGR